jgi:tRNA (guanine26-N2/guanine27-N2)-dimethyltransferase
MITEGKVKLNITPEKIVSKKMETFYNPVMKLNRDISILLLNEINKKNMQIALPLAGSGIRGIRFLKEVKKSKIKYVEFNDLNKNAIKSIKENLKLNKIKNKLKISNQDANLFLLESKGFDYIDIDPFGSPNFLLNNAILRLSRQGILAVTATDTGCLSGSFPKACKRKYWASPLRTETMHEIGLRILIRKIQLIGAQFDKALTPIFAYSKDHYFRVFLQCKKGKEKADGIIKQQNFFNQAGPMWLGQLWDTKLVNKMKKNNKIEENKKFLNLIEQESKIDTIGFYDITRLGKKYKLKSLPKQQDLIKKIKKKGFKVSETHFRENSIRTNIEEKELIKILQRNT